ncbi:expressed unknown protein [Seminavis robusta]|uniref:Uncharacterized protein n=1 Tax=Seminavis robusta TaxID=568900 RepID=A0A9N8EVS9_9STRA|nr:expressed unknown protein [Seminavis robusta]|eukprot:Sro2029_g311760.1 n/a (487) ;mRNA; f:3244-4704
MADESNQTPLQAEVTFGWRGVLLIGSCILAVLATRQEVYRLDVSDIRYNVSKTGAINVLVSFNSDRNVNEDALVAAMNPAENSVAAQNEEPATVPEKPLEKTEPTREALEKNSEPTKQEESTTQTEQATTEKPAEEEQSKVKTEATPEQPKQHTTPTIDKTLPESDGQALRGTSTAVETTSAVPQEDASSGGNKTLVIIMGTLRGGEYTWQSMYKNLLDLNNADLALAVGEVAEDKKTSSLYKRAHYVWEFHEYEDWGDALDLIAKEQKPGVDPKTDPESWREIMLPHFPGLFGGVGDIPGSGAVIFWIRWFIQNKLKHLNLLDKYDQFIVTRSDFYYLCEHDISEFNATEVWVPDGEDYHGITDRFVLAPADKILKVLDILPPFLKKSRHHRNKLPKKAIQREGMGPERFILWRWDDDGIKAQRYPRVMFTVKTPSDSSRWNTGAKTSASGQMKTGPHGLILKYRSEYFRSQKVCQDILQKPFFE